MSTENIVKFLQTAYSDEKLAALLAHAQDGKLAYDSCCCLIGVPSAVHALKPARGLDFLSWEGGSTHHVETRATCAFARAAEGEFLELGRYDAERRERLIPLILAEMERREKLAISILPSRKPLVRIPEGSDQGDEQPEWDDTDTSRELYSGIQRGCQ